jgi:HSP20 family protein
MLIGGEFVNKDKQNLPNDFYKQASEVLGEEFWQEIGELIPNTGPRIDIYYTSNNIMVLAEVPGLQSPEQIGIFLEGQTLILEGEIPCVYPVTDNRIIQKERFFGKFRRTLPLPKPVSLSQFKAKYARGLLIIEMQIEPTVQQTNIPIEFS